VVVISNEVGLRKPDPAIYCLAARELAVPLKRILFVDDTAANLQPAQELGLAVLYNVDPARTVEELERLLAFSDRPSSGADGRYKFLYNFNRRLCRRTAAGGAPRRPRRGTHRHRPIDVVAAYVRASRYWQTSRAAGGVSGSAR